MYFKMSYKEHTKDFTLLSACLECLYWQKQYGFNKKSENPRRCGPAEIAKTSLDKICFTKHNAKIDNDG